MLKKVVSEILLALLLISMLILAFNIQPVKGSGTIYIRADGSVDPSTALISSVDNVTYAFKGNINDSIVVERSNIIIDGNRYTLQGAGARWSKGIYLSGVSNVAVTNINIKDFYYGVYANQSSLHSIFANNITNNEISICLDKSSNNNVYQNNITNTRLGIYLRSSLNNNIFGNRIKNCGEAVLLSSSNNTISRNDIANSIDGVDISYSSNNTVTGNNVTNSRYGIRLYDSSNSTISENKIENSKDSGIDLSGSSGSTIFGNVIRNSDEGVRLTSSSNNTLSRNNITNNTFGLCLYGGDNNSLTENTFFEDGLYVVRSYGNKVENNLVNGKPLIYLEGVSDYTVENAGQVILIRCSNISVEKLNLTSTTVGVELLETSDTKISANNITNSTYGILLFLSSSNSMIRNNITNSSHAGIDLLYSSNNSIRGNNITNNNRDITQYGGGITLYKSESNRVSGNNITANKGSGIMLRQSLNNSIVGNNITNSWGYGILLYQSSNSFVYHNNFVYNLLQSGTYNSVNAWDDGYPSGGNYWTVYTYAGVDVKSGTGQDLPGSDGIGDTALTMRENNIDHYPLMAPISVFDAGTWNGTSYNVDIISNSTVSKFQLNVTEKTIRFNVMGETGSGFCRVTLPNVIIQDMWQGNYTVLINGETWSFTNWTDTENTYIYFTYQHSEHEITIIPEFPTATILTLFMIFSMPVIVFAKRKLSRKQKT